MRLKEAYSPLWDEKLLRVNPLRKVDVERVEVSITSRKIDQQRSV